MQRRGHVRRPHRRSLRILGGQAPASAPITGRQYDGAHLRRLPWPPSSRLLPPDQWRTEPTSAGSRSSLLLPRPLPRPAGVLAGLPRLPLTPDLPQQLLHDHARHALPVLPPDSNILHLEPQQWSHITRPRTRQSSINFTTKCTVDGGDCESSKVCQRSHARTWTWTRTPGKTQSQQPVSAQVLCLHSLDVKLQIYLHSPFTSVMKIILKPPFNSKRSQNLDRQSDQM